MSFSTRIGSEDLKGLGFSEKDCSCRKIARPQRRLDEELRNLRGTRNAANTGAASCRPQDPGHTR